MKRDEFIKKSLQAGLASGCMMAVGGTAVFSQEDIKLKKCKITVLKKTFHEDLAVSFSVSEMKPCDRFNEGDEFIVEYPF